MGCASHPQRIATSSDSRLPSPPCRAIFGGSRRDPDEGKAKRWLAFLNNHREVIAALDICRNLCRGAPWRHFHLVRPFSAILSFMVSPILT